MMQTTGMTDTFVPKIVSGLTLGGTSLAAADWSIGVFGVPLAALLAAAGGSLIALSALPADEIKPGRLIGVVFTGFMIGIYLSQIIVWGQELKPIILPPLAFFCALFGQWGMMLVFKDGRDIALAWIRRSLGLPPSDGGAP